MFRIFTELRSETGSLELNSAKERDIAINVDHIVCVRTLDGMCMLVDINGKQIFVKGDLHTVMKTISGAKL